MQVPPSMSNYQHTHSIEAQVLVPIVEEDKHMGTYTHEYKLQC